MRAIGLDIHLDFCEVAIAEGGELRSGRSPIDHRQPRALRPEPRQDDRVALEVTGNAWEVVRIIRPHVAESSPQPADTADPLGPGEDRPPRCQDSGAAVAGGQLDWVWVPDEQTQAMRRRLAAPKPARPRPLGGQERDPRRADAAADPEARRSATCSARQGPRVARRDRAAGGRARVRRRAACARSTFLDSEIAAVDAVIAAEALGSPEIRRLMTVPGVGAITAAAFMAAVGDISRFSVAASLVAYLGLDPIVRQSGSGEAAYGRISKHGSASGRYALVEASWSVVKAPGPLRSFYERTKGRRGAQVAIVATARKLACLFWTLLSRGEDYAFGQPSLHRRKLRQLELTAGAPSRRGGKGAWHASPEARQAERELAEQAEAAYRRNVAEFKRVEAARAKQRQEAEKAAAAQQREEKGGRRRDIGARILKSPNGDKQRGGPHAPGSAL